jgi:hypothetical protein
MGDLVLVKGKANFDPTISKISSGLRPKEPEEQKDLENRNPGKYTSPFPVSFPGFLASRCLPPRVDNLQGECYPSPNFTLVL